MFKQSTTLVRKELSIVSLACACGVKGSKLVAACSMFKLHGVSKFGVLLC